MEAFDLLPDEIFYQISEYLETPDLLSMSETQKRARAILGDIIPGRKLEDKRQKSLTSSREGLMSMISREELAMKTNYLPVSTIMTNLWVSNTQSLN